MKSKFISTVTTLSGLVVASSALAADIPTGSPNQQAEHEWLSMPSDTAINGNGQTYALFILMYFVAMVLFNGGLGS